MILDVPGSAWLEGTVRLGHDREHRTGWVPSDLSSSLLDKLSTGSRSTLAAPQVGPAPPSISIATARAIASSDGSEACTDTASS